ncbi:hypothetical protein [Candidatus Manganitrophus noduliformans]|uniref:N-acetyltransferase domain-containing protein n=1 Tax=Candidatus Manganitrophus noduliformans TaxID=2606439 RepID=A0A7X6DMH2_9BACT|nr:hypothetical protein [Candidatus Manganitrophus noduliformans]NKE69905.1 hypothetical protein [Candidatus Manganitrophus noduliformans]
MENQVGMIRMAEVVPPESPQLHIELAVTFPKDKFDAIWSEIKPFVEELAAASAGEYDAYSVAHALLFGTAHLYVGRLTNPARTFVGYLLIRYEPQSCHIWQAYIAPEFRKTNVFQMGADYIEREFKKMGAKQITFSATREWGEVIEKMGFTRTYTIWRKSL